jgi:hypothetical protein
MRLPGERHCLYLLPLPRSLFLTTSKLSAHETDHKYVPIVC